MNKFWSAFMEYRRYLEREITLEQILVRRIAQCEEAIARWERFYTEEFP